MTRIKRLSLFYLVLTITYFFVFNSCKKKDASNSGYPPNTVVDIDGNVYNTVTICSKTWMVENLKATKFNDGTLIPCITDSTIWDTLQSPGYCWYKNDLITYKHPYGALYNWFSVNTGKLAPKGWHIPTIIEWYQLINCIGGINVAGSKLKEKGTTHWQSPNDDATNEFGFTAIPTGGREYMGSFESIGTQTEWWTSSGNVNSNACYVRLYNLHGYMQDNVGPLQTGFSVRCIKD